MTAPPPPRVRLDAGGVALAMPTQNGAHDIRAVATGLLLLAAAVFIGTSFYEDAHPAVGYVRAFAEAAMVGGLADWFAVTALFRHPFGLPIPHTAIVPRNKDRIGDTLAVFIKQNFLLPRLIARKMQHVDVAGALGRFLSQPSGDAGRMRGGASRMIADALASLDPARLGGMLKGAVADRIRAMDVAPLLGQALAAAMVDGRHRPVLDAAVKWLAKLLEDNEATIRQVVRDNSNTWIRVAALDTVIADRIIAGLQKLTAAMAEDPYHPFRGQIEARLARLADELQHDPAMQARVAQIRDEMLANQAVTRWLDGLWEQARGALLKAARNPDALMAGRLGDALKDIGAMLTDDPRMRTSINRFARRAAIGAVDSYGENALRLISDTVRSWDASTVTERLEGAVGRDLQYIRINGTLVGGLVGVVIHAVDVLL